MTDDSTSSYPRTDATTGTPGLTSATGAGHLTGTTESAGTSGTAWPTGTTGSTGSTGTADSTTDSAKEQAEKLKEKAADTGGHLLDEAKGEVAAVSGEARRQLSDLWSQARSEVAGQAGTQQSRLAGGLTSIAGQLNQMASSPTEQNLATDLVREVGDRADSLGRWLEDHGPDEVLEEVRRFARRRPGTFLLVAAGAGAVLGRLTRGLKDASGSESTTPARTATAETLPVYTDVVEERTPYADALTTPAPSTTGWDQR